MSMTPCSRFGATFITLVFLLLAGVTLAYGKPFRDMVPVDRYCTSPEVFIEVIVAYNAGDREQALARYSVALRERECVLTEGVIFEPEELLDRTIQWRGETHHFIAGRLTNTGRKVYVLHPESGMDLFLVPGERV